MNILKNPLFLLGGIVLIIGLISKASEDIDNYIIGAGIVAIVASFFVHITPIRLGT